MERSLRHSTTQLPLPLAEVPRTAPYLRVPDRLLRRFARDPLAVGVYLAVARCALTQRGAVPLSPADLAEWGSGDRGRDSAIMRRINLLLAEGWLIAKHGRAVKLRLLPTWGAAFTSTQLAWDFAAAQLGKPDALRVRRVSLELFDTYLGRIDPLPGRTPALITRYFDRPLISLFDLGVYVLATLTAQQPTGQLQAVGLFDGQLPQPPRSLSTFLELAEQGELTMSGTDSGGAVLLSNQGQQHRQRAQTSTAMPHAKGTHPSDAELSRVSNSPNGSLYGSPNGSAKINQSGGDLAHLDALKRRSPTQPAHAAWDRSIEVHGIESPTMSRSWMGGGGGGIAIQLRDQKPISQHDSERNQLLQAIGIRHRAGLANTRLHCSAHGMQ